jgi:hypothetical protein
VRLAGDIQGVLETSCTLKVRNAAGQEASASILFKPTLVYETLSEDHLHINRPHFNSPFELIENFFGERLERTAFRGMGLWNQWTVLSGHLEVGGEGAGHGADILRQPVRGSNRPEFHFGYWADGFVRVWVHPYAIIRGPKGLRY